MFLLLLVIVFSHILFVMNLLFERVYVINCTFFREYSFLFLFRIFTVFFLAKVSIIFMLMINCHAFFLFSFICSDEKKS